MYALDSTARSSHAKMQTVAMPSNSSSRRVVKNSSQLTLALVDVEVLVDAGGRAGWVENVAESGGSLVVEGVRDVEVGEFKGDLHGQLP
jgi:hypothetical protein